MSAAKRDDNREVALILQNTLGTGVLYPTAVSLTDSVAQHVAIVDGNGDQITSFGGGTQYTDAGTPPTHPTGNALVFDNGSSAWQAVNSTHGLPINVLNASIAVTGTFWQATQPISAVSLPLPTGAATAAKQPALGTAGTASTDVITVQGIASMTALKVDGSAVTQPVSGTFWQATQPVSLASVPSHPVTNAGTFAVQSTLQTGTNQIGHLEANQSVNMAQIGGSSTATGHGTASGSLRVELPTDGTGVVGLNAGSNIIGKVGIDQTTPGTTNAITPVPASNSGWTFAYQAGGLSSTKWQIKGSAGTLGGYINLINPNTATTYIQVFNKASANVTVGSTTPDFVIVLPGVASASATGAAANLEVTLGIAMSTGITVAATTTETGSTGPANNVFVTWLYK